MVVILEEKLSISRDIGSENSSRSNHRSIDELSPLFDLLMSGIKVLSNTYAFVYVSVISTQCLKMTNYGQNLCKNVYRWYWICYKINLQDKFIKDSYYKFQM